MFEDKDLNIFLNSLMGTTMQDGDTRERKELRVCTIIGPICYEGKPWEKLL